MALRDDHFRLFLTIFAIFHFLPFLPILSFLTKIDLVLKIPDQDHPQLFGDDPGRLFYLGGLGGGQTPPSEAKKSPNHIDAVF